MKEKDFFSQYSQAVEMAECRIADFKIFSEKYNLNDRDFFAEKLLNMGYDNEDVLSIIMNKDLLLSMYMNSFESIRLENNNDNHVDLDIEIERARHEYMDAIDVANEAIEAANEAKKIMSSLQYLIESKFGYNSNNWDEQSVHEMNEAIICYNRLVQKANDDVEKSNIARQNLAKVRSEQSDKKTYKIDITNRNDIALEAS